MQLAKSLPSPRSTSPGVRLGLAPPTEIRAAAGYHLLGVVAHGDAPPVGAPPAVLVRTPLRPMGRPRIETFESTGQPEFGQALGIEYAEDGRILFGRVDLLAEGPIETAARDGFERLLSVSRRRGFAHPLRVWASIPRIHEAESGLERYRAFCRGRSQAFESAFGAAFPSHLCASSAVGSADGPPTLYFLASREAGTHCENPRQLAAYRYPRCYGPRSPSFARATIAPEELERTTFVSGTASIVGHENQHPGNVSAQVEETLRNLQALLASLPDSPPIEEAFQLLKVYVRHPSDEPIVRAALEAREWTRVPTLILRADICREGLLVEIEAVGPILAD